MMFRALLGIWVLAFGAVLALQVPQTGGAVNRRYWVVPLDSVAIGHTAHTHLEVWGRVTLVRHEDDGDMHLKLVGRLGFIVGECIPRLPCSRLPRVGEYVGLRGIFRRDVEHGWFEIHPIEQVLP